MLTTGHRSEFQLTSRSDNMATVHLGLHPSFAVVPLVSQALAVFYALVEPTIFVPFLRAAGTDQAATQRVVRL